MTPNHFIFNICKALLIFKAQLNYNQIKLMQLSRVNLGSVRIGWLDSILNDGKQEKNLERIRRKMFVLYVSTLEMAKIAKKGKKVDGRVGQLDRARPKLCSSSILMMKKIIAKKFRKRKSPLTFDVAEIKYH